MPLIYLIPLIIAIKYPVVAFIIFVLMLGGM